MKPIPKREPIKFVSVRLPANLHRLLVEKAEGERRSVNSEVVHLIARHVEKEAA